MDTFLINNEVKEYRYKAFISYRHLEPDKFAAERLQKMLEQFHIGKGQKPWRIFRDESELPTSNNLSQDIHDALVDSEFLIVICSKKLSESRWCMEEIETFKSLHNNTTENILTLLVEGTPEEAFPKQICYSEEIVVDAVTGEKTRKDREVEPLAANIVAPSRKEMVKKLKTEYLRIAAPLSGLSFDQLYDRRKRKQIRQIMIGSIATLSVVAVASTCFAFYNAKMRNAIDEQLKLTEIENEKYLNQLEQTEIERNKYIEQLNQTQLENTRFLIAQSNQYYSDGKARDAIESVMSAFEVTNDSKPLITDAVNVLAGEIGAFKNESYLPNIRLEHPYEVTDYWFLVGGSRIVSIDKEHNIYLWNAQTGDLIKDFSKEGLTGEVLIKDQNLLSGGSGLEKRAVGTYSARVSDVSGELVTGYVKSSTEDETYIDDKSYFVISSGDKLYYIDAKNGDTELVQGQEENNVTGEDELAGMLKLLDRGHYRFAMMGNQIIGYDYWDYSTNGIEIYDEEGRSIVRKLTFADPTTAPGMLFMNGIKLITGNWIFFQGGIDLSTGVYASNIVDDVIQSQIYQVECVPEEIADEKQNLSSVGELYLVDDSIISVAFSGALSYDTCYINLMDENSGKSQWKYQTVLHNYTDIDLGIVYGENSGNDNDLIYLECGNKLVFLDKKTGQLVREYEFDSAIAKLYYKECGFFFITLTDGTNEVISVRNYKDYNKTIFLIEGVNCKVSNYKYCIGTAAITTKRSKNIDLYNSCKNSDYQELYVHQKSEENDSESIKEVWVNEDETLMVINAYKAIYIYNFDDRTIETLLKTDDYIGDTSLVKNNLWVKQKDNSYCVYDIGNLGKPVVVPGIKQSMYESRLITNNTLGVIASSFEEKDEKYSVTDIGVILSSDGKDFDKISCDGEKILAYSISDDGSKILMYYKQRKEDAELIDKLGVFGIADRDYYVDCELPAQANNVTDAFWNEKADKVVVIYEDGEAAIYNAETGKLEKNIQIKNREIVAGTYVDNEIFVVCKNNEMIKLDAEGQELARLDLDPNLQQNSISDYDVLSFKRINADTLLYSKRGNAVIVDLKNTAIKYNIGYSAFSSDDVEFQYYDTRRNRLICKEHNRVTTYPLYSEKELYDKAKKILK